MTLGVDYAWSLPDPAGMYDAGIRFAGRYVGAGTADKRLTRDEAMALNLAGIRCVSLVEGASQDALRGYAMGRDHASAAVRELAAIGAPDGRPMYFALDWDVQAADWPAVTQYLTGAASVIGWERVGVYGGLRAVQLARESAGVRWLFQTYAWSHGVWYPAATMRQTHNGVDLAGGKVDMCWSDGSDIGGWLLAGAVPVNEGDDEMTPEQDAMLRETHERILNINSSLYLASGTGGIPPVPAEDRWGPNGMSAALVDQINYLCHTVGKIADTPPALDLAAIRQVVTDAVTVAIVGSNAAGQSQMAAEVSSAVMVALGTLTGSFALSGPHGGPDAAPQPG